VHVSLLDNTRKELPVRLYGKVMHVKSGASLRAAMVRSRRTPPALEFIRTATNQARSRRKLEWSVFSS
jgi:hypothetical protein